MGAGGRAEHGGRGWGVAAGDRSREGHTACRPCLSWALATYRHYRQGGNSAS